MSYPPGTPDPSSGQPEPDEDRNSGQDAGQDPEASAASPPYGGTPYSQDPYGQPPYGQPGYGPEGDDQAGYRGSPPPAPGQQAYSPAGYGDPYGQPLYSEYGYPGPS